MPKKIQSIGVGPGCSSTFLLSKKQTYSLQPLGYVNKNSGKDSVYDPDDLLKVKITEQGILNHDLKIFLVVNNSGSSFNVNIFEQV